MKDKSAEEPMRLENIQKYDQNKNWGESLKM